MKRGTRRRSAQPVAGGVLSMSIPLGQILRGAVAILAPAGIDAARLEAEVLLAHALDTSRERLLLGLRDPAPAALWLRLEPLLQRRIDGHPLQYITGVQEFWSLEFRVDRRVLIPRSETELLVEQALRRAPGAAPRIADIGTGSGCIAVALAHERSDAHLLGVDRSADALDLARENAGRLVPSAEIRWLQSDLLDGVDAGWDLIISNPPYIREDELTSLPTDVRDHEPHGALIAGESGLEVIERLVSDAAPRLSPGGSLLLEIGVGQWPQVQERIRRAAGYEEPQVVADFQGIPRVVAARRRDA